MVRDCRGLPLIELSLPFLIDRFCVVVLLPNPLPPLLPRSSTAGRYSALCRITLNLLSFLLNIP